MSARGIHIDAKPDIEFKVSARVEEEDGRARLVPNDQSRWLATLGRMVGDVTVTLSRPKKAHSDEAQGYLWRVVYQDILAGLREIAVKAGELCPFKDDEALHEAFKYMILGTEVVTIGGVEITRPASTMVLDSAEYAAYISQVKAIAADSWRIYAREPNERVAI